MLPPGPTRAYPFSGVGAINQVRALIGVPAVLVLIDRRAGAAVVMSASRPTYQSEGPA